MTTMDRRVKERLVGASILAVLIVLIVPELLSGPAPAPEPVPKLPAITPEPVRNITVDLATSRAPALEPSVEAASASSAQPQPQPQPQPPPRSASQPPSPPPQTRSVASPPPALPAAARKPVTPAGAWSVQLGSFASRANADKLLRQLKSQGYAAYLVPGGSGSSSRYRVRVGPMADHDAAAQAAAKLKSLGHAGSLVSPAP